jgi:pteridine reductase
VEVKDKVAVVTGGARRVGRAIVEALAAAGAMPVIHYHESREEALELARRVDGQTARADLSRPEGAGELVEQVQRLRGERELAVWVNSAASFTRAPFLESDDDLWRETLQLVLLSPVSCIRAVAPRMARGGVIVNVLDVAAHQPWSGYAHHCVAKASLLMLTRSLALELGPDLRVCGVTPGVVLPEEDGHPPRMAQRVPLGREGSPEDVARAVCYLVEADYVTGSVLAVDGGLMARSVL